MNSEPEILVHDDIQPADPAWWATVIVWFEKAMAQRVEGGSPYLVLNKPREYLRE